MGFIRGCSSIVVVRAFGPEKAAPSRDSRLNVFATPPPDARTDTDQGLLSVRVMVWISYPFPHLSMANDSKPSTKPVKTYRFRGISASVFENQTEKGDPFYKVQIVRTYKDGKDFKSTPTFSRDELPVVMLVSQQAYDFVLCSERDNRREENAQ